MGWWGSREQQQQSTERAGIPLATCGTHRASVDEETQSTHSVLREFSQFLGALCVISVFSVFQLYHF
jgi:hypothetical protein